MLAYFALGEVLGAVGIAGAAVIIVGILISEFGDQLIPWSGEREGI